MKKHLSVLIMNLSANFNWMMGLLGLVFVYDIAVLAIVGLKKPTFGDALDAMPQITVWLLWGFIIVSTIYKRIRKNKEDKGVLTESVYVFERLKISEREVIFWSWIGSMLRVLLYFCFHAVTLYIMYLIWTKFGAGEHDPLTTFVDFSDDRWLVQFLPGSGARHFIHIGICVFTFGALAALLDRSLRGVGNAAIFFLIIIILTIGSSKGTQYSIGSELILAVIGVTALLYLFFSSHNGKRAPREAEKVIGGDEA